MKKYILSLDAGTSSVRAILFDEKHRAVAIASKELTQIYPRPSWVEQEPLEIFTSQIAAIVEVMNSAGISAKNIDSIGIANQRETIVVWDRTTGKAIYNAIVWQCSRGEKKCQALRAKGLEELITKKTGLKLDAYFSATKLEWILDNVENARKRAEDGDLICGTIDTWLMWKLSDGEIFATDYTNASRTLLFNIHTLDWDDELLKIFNIPRIMLPKVRPSSYFYGECSNDYLPKGMKICAVAGDQQSSLFGHKCFNKGDIKNTFGTGGFLLMNIGDKPQLSSNGLLTTIACSPDNKVVYAIEGSIFVSGAIIRWLRDELGLISSPQECNELAEKVKDNHGCYLVPAFVGLAAPYWDSRARAIITGLKMSTNKCHLARASLESMAYQTYDIILAMQEDTKEKACDIFVDGGGASSDFLLQFLADISGKKVIRPHCIETTALGVAYLSGLCSGYWKSLEDIKQTSSGYESFSPVLPVHLKKELIEGWKSAVSQSLEGR